MNSQYAILTKSRAMFKGRLTDRNYSEMLQCKSVRDIAAYLKTKTSYEKFFQNMNTASIHRGWLEANLKNVLFKELEALSHYDFALGDRCYEYFITVGEMQQLLRCIALLNSGMKDKYLLTMPEFFNDRSVLDLTALGKAESTADILKVLDGTPYSALCTKFIDTRTGVIDTMSLAKALDEYRLEKLFMLIEQNTSGDEKKELLEVANTAADMYNINILFRTARLNAAGSPISGRSLIMPFGSLDQDTMALMERAADSKSFISILRTTKYKKYLKSEEYRYIELATNEIFYATAIHRLRFSPHPLVVMFSYADLFKLEINNIIHIVEGVRYNVETDKIEALLVGYKRSL